MRIAPPPMFSRIVRSRVGDGSEYASLDGMSIQTTFGIISSPGISAPERSDIFAPANENPSIGFPFQAL